MSTRDWPNAERFDDCIRHVDRLTIDSAVAALDAGNYWPEPRPLSHKRSHVRWMMRRAVDKEGRPRWSAIGQDVEDLRAELDERDVAMVELIESDEWQTLEDIRQKLERLEVLSPHLSERDQVHGLELLFGTEQHDGILTDETGKVLVICHLDENAVDPEPVYKVAARCTRDEFARHIDELESREREVMDDMRARGAVPKEYTELEDEDEKTRDRRHMGGHEEG